MSAKRQPDQLSLIAVTPETTGDFDLEKYIADAALSNETRPGPTFEPDPEDLERRSGILQEQAGFSRQSAEQETSAFVPKDPPSPGRKRTRRTERELNPPLKPGHEMGLADLRPWLKPGLGKAPQRTLVDATQEEIAKARQRAPQRDPEDTLRAFDG